MKQFLNYFGLFIGIIGVVASIISIVYSIQEGLNTRAFVSVLTLSFNIVMTVSWIKNMVTIP